MSKTVALAVAVGGRLFKLSNQSERDQPRSSCLKCHSCYHWGEVLIPIWGNFDLICRKTEREKIDAEIQGYRDEIKALEAKIQDAEQRRSALDEDSPSGSGDTSCQVCQKSPENPLECAKCNKSVCKDCTRK